MAEARRPKTDEAAAEGIPPAPWAAAIASRRDASRLLPQTIAHRGYKALYPENTMAAFRAAVQAGAHALETDVHLSADGVAVLSHDATLVRCFGVRARVDELGWEALAALRSLRRPSQGVPRLRDLLAWLADVNVDVDAERRGRVWVLLDIKLDDDAHDLLAAIAHAIADVPPGAVPWERRIMLGCWNASTLRAARAALPAFALAHIGFSLSYAHHFLAAAPPRLSFNLAQHVLRSPWRGRGFVRAVRGGRRLLLAWTVNSERAMRWSLARGAGLLDGVVTDDPARFLAACDRYEDELDGRAPPPPLRLADALALALRLVMHLLSHLFFLYRRFWLRKLDYMHEPVASVRRGAP